MNDTKSTSLYWVYFFLSAVGIILMLVYVRQYFWLVLPWVCTSLAKALRIM
ncbi:MAG TPA: hypothetical protein VG847_08660 [Chitinophagaceae bacterium]|nr:hypothetical protein [Chitinophagaceae bacterium]